MEQILDIFTRDRKDEELISTEGREYKSCNQEDCAELLNHIGGSYSSQPCWYTLPRKHCTSYLNNWYIWIKLEIHILNFSFLTREHKQLLACYNWSAITDSNVREKKLWAAIDEKKKKRDIIIANITNQDSSEHLW